MSYKSVGTDLDDFVRHFKSTATEAQKREYSRRGKGRKKDIIRSQFGSNHAQPLRWLREDGGDGEPVGSMAPKSATAFWDYGSTHVYPPMRDLVRIGLFFHQDFYCLVALALKGEWERFVGGVLGYATGASHNLTNTLYSFKVQNPLKCKYRKQAGESVSYDMLRLDFEPELERISPELFRLLEDHGKLATQAGYNTPEILQILLREMLGQGLQLRANSSDELSKFIASQREQQDNLRQGTDQQREEFWKRKIRLLKQFFDMGDILLQIDDQRFYQANIELQWMKVFGDEEIALREAMAQVDILKLRIALKEQNRGLSRQDLDREVAETVRKTQVELENARITMLYARQQVSTGKLVTLEDEEYQRLREKCRKLEMELDLLLHPDQLELKPVWQNLSADQKAYLKELWHELRRIANVYKVQNPDLLRFSKVPLDWLLDLRAEARTILENAGLEINVDLTIPSGSLPEQLDWLGNAIARLERGMAEQRQELRKLLADEKYHEWKDILDKPDTHEEERAKLQERVEEYQKEISELQKRLEDLFQETVPGGRDDSTGSGKGLMEGDLPEEEDEDATDDPPTAGGPA